MKNCKTLVVLSFCATMSVRAGTTAFSFQGQLLSTGTPTTGLFDFQFFLYAAPTNGTPIANPVTNNAVAVTGGVFVVSLDFGPGVFTGASRWLEVAVSTNGAAGFITLVPRQPILPAPMALYSAISGSAASYTGAVSGAQLTSPIPLGMLPAGMLTNNATNVSLSGAFSGDGSGLTGVKAAPSLPGYDISSISTVTANVGNTAFPGLVHKLAWTNSTSTNLQCEILRAAWTYDPMNPTTEGSITPITQSSWPDTMPMYINFGFDGSYFIFGIQGKHCPVVIAINNTDWAINVPVPFDTGYHYYKVQFSSSARRQITLKTSSCDGAAHQFLGVWIDPSSGWWSRSPGKKYRMIVLGSSYVEEPGPSSGAYPNTGYPSDLMYLFSNLETWASGSGGTGIVQTNGIYRTNYLGRVARDVIPYKPDMLLIDAMANDDSSPSNSIYANATAIFDIVRSNLPACKIIVATSPFWGSCPAYSTSDLSWKTYLAITNAMKDAGVTNFIDTFTDPVFPTGFNPVYESAGHPTAPGCWVYAEALAAGLGTICPELTPSGYAVPGTPLTVPTGLTAAGGSNSVFLAWRAPVVAAASYNIKRSANSDAETFLTNVQATSFTDLGVSNGTTYYYVLSAVSSSGAESADSYEVAITPAVPPMQGPLNVRMNAVRYLAAFTNVFSDYAGTTPAIDGGNVRLWKDNTTNGYDLAARFSNANILHSVAINSQAAIGQSPVYDWWSMTNSLGMSETSISQPLSVLIVGQITNTSAWFMGLNTTDASLKTVGDVTYLSSTQGSVGGHTSGPPPTNAVWYLVTYNGNSSTFYINGTNACSTQYIQATSPSGMQGLWMTADPVALRGLMSEFAEYQGIPSASDLNVISNYCAIRYGIHN
jgi:hypothetical protein